MGRVSDKGLPLDRNTAQKLDEWLDMMASHTKEDLEEMQNSLIFDTKENDSHLLPEMLDVVGVKVVYDDAENSVNDEGMKSGTVTFHNKDMFHGYFSPCLGDRVGTHHEKGKYGGVETTGRWTAGLLEGFAVKENCYGGYEETFYKRGVKHGYSRNYGPRHGKKGNLWGVTLYREGQMYGQFWQGCLGGGYITGIAKNNQITGDNIAYIFPNLRDAVFGTFSNGKFLSGFEAELSSVDIMNGMAVGSFTKNQGDHKVARDRSTSYKIALNPMVPDRQEHSRVEVRESNTPDSGEGLFAKIAFKEGDLVALLNGIRSSPALDDDWSDYKVNFNTELDLDIPTDMRRYLFDFICRK